MEPEASDSFPESMHKFAKLYGEFARDVMRIVDISVDDDVRQVTGPDYDPACAKRLYDHCSKTYLPLFLDIIYKKDDVFKNGIEFFPGVTFDDRWSDFDEQTRSSFWKYVQLVLIVLVDNHSKTALAHNPGTPGIGEMLDSAEVKEQFAKTVSCLQSVAEGRDASECEKKAIDDMCDMDALCDTKIGAIAREIAEETMGLMGESDSPDDAIGEMMKNPANLFSLVKNIGTKLEDKMASGELKQNELFEEAFAMMGKMKDMPGMPNMDEMIGALAKGKPPRPPGAKAKKRKTNVAQAAATQKLEAAKTAERLRKKLEERQLA